LNELRTLSLKMSNVRAVNSYLTFNLSDYVDQVRGGTLKGAGRAKAWRSILETAWLLSLIVQDTLDLFERSQWLEVRLEPHDRLALREVLLGRVSVLTRLRSLPPPGTTDEIEQLDQMNIFYRQLIKSLGQLNETLTRAIDRLARG
jgi:hypothetical protein